MAHHQPGCVQTFCCRPRSHPTMVIDPSRGHSESLISVIVEVGVKPERHCQARRAVRESLARTPRGTSSIRQMNPSRSSAIVSTKIGRFVARRCAKEVPCQPRSIEPSAIPRSKGGASCCQNRCQTVVPLPPSLAKTPVWRSKMSAWSGQRRPCRKFPVTMKEPSACAAIPFPVSAVGATAKTHRPLGW